MDKGVAKRRKTGLTARRPRTVPRSTATAAERGPQRVRTRSFPCPDDLWAQAEAFARERGLGSTADGLRVLLRSGLRVERRIRELDAARDWQIEQAWAEVQAIAAGDQTVGSWDDVEQAAERARARIRQREAALAEVAARP